MLLLLGAAENTSKSRRQPFDIVGELHLQESIEVALIHDLSQHVICYDYEEGGGGSCELTFCTFECEEVFVAVMCKLLEDYERRNVFQQRVAYCLQSLVILTRTVPRRLSGLKDLFRRHVINSLKVVVVVVQIVPSGDTVRAQQLGVPNRA
jgi:hypothetical protein